MTDSAPSTAAVAPATSPAPRASARDRTGPGIGRTLGLAPLVWLTVLALIGVVAVPVLFILLQAVFPEIGRGSLVRPFAEVGRSLSQPGLLGMGVNTLRLGLSVALVSAVIAIPMAVARALYRVPGALVWDVLMIVPFMIPPYIATLGWVLSLQPRGFLQQLTGVNLAPLLFSVPGMVAIMALNAFPVVYFALSRTLEAVGARQADVARIFGARPRVAFFRITLPLSIPGLTAALLLVFAMAIEEYGTPAALGRRVGFEVLVTGIETSLADWPVDLPRASVLSLLLIGLSLAAFLLQRWIVARRNWDVTTGKPQARAKLPLGAMTLPVMALFGCVAFLATGVPILAILATALSRTLSGGLTWSNLGLNNFAAILGDTSGGLTALANSLLLGVGTALAAGALGALAAYLVVRTRMRGRLALDLLTVMPNAVPGVVVALGLILAWNQPSLPLTPYNTAWILLLAYTCILLPQPVRYATAALQQIGPSLEDAARTSGAGPLTVFRRILLPLILPSLVSAMLLVFAVASRELVASLLVAPVGMKTTATFIWRQFDQGSVGVGMAMAFVTILITTLLPLVLLRVLNGTAVMRG